MYITERLVASRTLSFLSTFLTTFTLTACQALLLIDAHIHSSKQRPSHHKTQLNTKILRKNKSDLLFILQIPNIKPN